MVTLIGLDFGTTTSSAMIASAQLLRNSITGRMELSQIRETFRSDMVFTPLCGDRLDEQRAAEYLDYWLMAGGVRAETVFGGGALLTGLTAQKENAAAVVRLVRRRLGDVLIASADDPCLESWLAFMGNCAALSRLNPETWFINVDIGGGTTNLALGKNGDVRATGCLLAGARHVQVVPGTYRTVELSPYARRLLDHLGIHKDRGDELLPGEVQAVLGYYLRLLEATLAGRSELLDEPLARLHQQVAFRPQIPSFTWEDAVVTLSGGVGELVHAAVQGRPLPATTAFGDLGVDLAAALLQESSLADHFCGHVPAGGGRATAFGLLRHSTQVSGTTVFLPDPHVLPLRDLPVLGSITDSSPESELRSTLDLVSRSAQGGCVRVELADRSLAGVRTLGTRVGQVLERQGFPADRPLVILVPDNVGKVLGQYVTRWGTRPITLVVIDEIVVRDGQYVHIGTPRDQAIPVSFYGLQA